MGQERISRDIKGFNADITSTSSYLLISNTATPPVFNWQRLGWTLDDLTFWQAILFRWQALFTIYINKKGGRTTDVKDQLYQIIDECVAYEQEHHLYERIAINPKANNTDFETFRIKRNTPLADVTISKAPLTGGKTVSIAIKKIEHLYHKLLVTALDKKGRAKEEGVKEIMVFKAVTAPGVAAPTIDKFQYVGDVKRGLIGVNHLATDEGNRAWYYAVAKNTQGELGPPSAVISCIIT
jgi:hypothetical protein